MTVLFSLFFYSAAQAVDANATRISEGLQSFADSLDGLDNLEELADPLAFTGLAPTGADGLRLANVFTESLKNKLAAKTFNSITELDDFLDDPDEANGDSDDGNYSGVEVDVEGTITTVSPSVFDLSLTVSLSRDGSTPIELALASIDASGGTLTTDLDLTATLAFRLDTSLSAGMDFFLPTSPATPALNLSLDADADFTSSPYVVNLGISEVSIGGTADIGTDFSASLVDPTADGEITQDDWEATAPLDMFDVSFANSHANLSLTVTSDLPGAPGGTITLADADLSPGGGGIGTPAVSLGDLGNFSNMTPQDFLGGIANLAGALSALQVTGPGDLDLPFMQEQLNEILELNQRFQNFFTSNSLSTASNPLTIGPGPAVTPEAWATILSGFDTVQEVRAGLATALGVSEAALAFTYDAAADKLNFSILKTDAPGTATAAVDFANQLERVGVVNIEDAASSVAITPSFTLDFGVGVDLTPPGAGETVLNQFSLETAGNEVVADAPVCANLDLVGRIGFLGLSLMDNNPAPTAPCVAGQVALLARTAGAPTQPMLTLNVDGGADNSMTLSELFALVAAAGFSGPAGSLTGTINAQVPSFTLDATATASGSTLANGSMTIAWADVTTGAPAVSTDASFNDELLDFDFNHTDPLALFNQVANAVEAFAEAVNSLVNSTEILSRDLPFAGSSFDDLGNQFQEVTDSINELIGDVPESLQILESRLESELETLLEALAPAGPITPAAAASILSVSLDTSGSQTTIVFDLAYGLCSAAGAGCSKVTGPLSLPFNFGLGDGNGGLVGLSGTGNVSLTYSALASVDFGVTLPAVTGGTNLGDVPTVAGSPSAFVVDTSTASLTANLSASGEVMASLGPIEVSIGETDGGSPEPFEAKVGAAITLDNDVAPAGPTRINVTDPAFATFISGLVPTDIGPAAQVSCAAPVGGPFDACAKLPIFLGSSDLGDITLTWNDLTQLSGPDGPQLSGVDAVLAALIAQGFDWQRLMDGLQLIAQFLADGLDGATFGEGVPIVGDALDAGADIFTKFDAFLNDLSGLVSDLEDDTEPSAIKSTIQSQFVTALDLGGGQTLLKDGSDLDPDPDAEDVDVVLMCDDGVAAPGGDGINGETACNDTDHNAIHLSDVRVGLSVGQTALTGSPVDFDLGLPGLRFEMKDQPGSSDDLKATIGWELDLAFGFSVREGFYLRTDNPSGLPAPGGDELTVSATLNLPSSTLNGDIAFLPFALTDNTPSPPGPDDLTLSLGVDLLGGGTDSKLAFNEIENGIDPDNAAQVDADLTGGINFDIHFETGPFGTEDASVPKFVADFVMTWNFATGDLLQGNVGNLSLAFNNVGIDLGSFLGDFLAPILEEANRLVKPLKPVVDIITAPIPGLTDAAKAAGFCGSFSIPGFGTIPDLCTLSLLDLYELQSGTELTLIRQLIALINFITAVGGAGAQPVLELGDFTLVPGTARAGELAPNEKGSLIGSESPGFSGSPLDVDDSSGGLGDTIRAALADAEKVGSEKGGFTWPAFDNPGNLFRLLLGQDVTLIHWDAGPLEAAVTIPLEIGPPIGPLPISVGITFQFGVRGHFAVGYDTRGIRLALQALLNDDPADDGFFGLVGTLFSGIGIDDRLRVNGEPTGEDIPEITLFGSLTAKAALDLLIAEAGIRGGVRATLDANLHDGGFGPAFHSNPADQFSHFPQNLDGVLRIEEIASFLGNPICLFDYSGEITAFLEAYIDYTLDEETFTIIGPVTIYSFTELFQSTCQQTPDLAHVDADTGDLVLHMGNFAGLRVYQTGEERERFVVRQLDAAGTKFSISAFGFEEEESGVTGKVFANGGTDTDTILLQAGASLSNNADGTINNTVIPFTKAAIICGGPGNDVIESGAGADKLVGDGTYVDPGAPGAPGGKYDCTTTEAGTDGNDNISAGDGVDNVWGLGAADRINGDFGGDSLRGGTGNDLIQGGPGESDGADTIIAGPLFLGAGQTDADTVFAGKGDDYVDGGADNDSIEGDEDDDTLLGWTGDDTIQGRTGEDDIFGEDDDDVLRGDEDDDFISGGDGDDDIFGDSGDDTLNGGDDNDDLVGGTDNTGVSGDTTGDTINGGAERDYLLGDEGTINRPTGQANGTIMCSGTFAGNDAMNGNDGDDVMYGCYGIDTMHGNAGMDDMHGGFGDDQMHGDDDADMMFGDQGEDTMNGNAGDDNPMRGGDDNDTMHGNAGMDTMFGDSGTDNMFGDEDNDTMRGNADPDCMEGNGAVDTMHGDAGNDNIIGGSSTAGAADEGDFIFGGIDDDTIAGDNADLCSPIVLLDVPFLGVVVDPNASGADTIEGGPDDDVIYGQSENDTISGNDGEDYIEGNNGVDTLNGNNDEDDIIGGSGRDEGGAGGTEREFRGVLDDGDIVEGGADVDFILGDNGKVTRPGGTYLPNTSDLRDVILYEVETVGGPAVDAGLHGSDNLGGGAGDDTMFGQGDNDTMSGGDGHDDMEGNTGADTMRGDAGQDDMAGGGSANDGVIDADRVGDGLFDGDEVAMYGESDATPGTPTGSGADVMAGDNARIIRTLDAGDTTWLVNSFDGNFVRSLVMFDLEIDGGAAINPDVHGNDKMWGNSNIDVMRGQGGMDEMHGGAGDDFMEGNHDVDTMFGDGEDDDMLGGSTAAGRLDAGDYMYGDTNKDGTSLDPAGVTKDGDDVMLGDNGSIVRPLTAGQWTPIVYHNGAASRIKRDVSMLDTAPGNTSGSDLMRGNGADDDMYGQFDDGAASTLKLNESPCDVETTEVLDVAGDLLCGDAGEDAQLGDQGVVVNRSEDAPLPPPAPGPREEHIEPKEPFIEDDIFVNGQLTRLITLSQITTGGDDILLGGPDGDWQHGGAGNDLINGNQGYDRGFGDDGTDALWGGEDHDHLYGGNGNDYLDVHPRPAETPNPPKDPIPADPPAWFVVAPAGDNFQGIDFIYGGFDQDAMQANVGDTGTVPGDRLIDWVGAFNIYYLCPGVYGEFVTTRDFSPHISTYLQDQATGDGAVDVATTGSSGHNELALVTSKDVKVNSNPAHPETPGHFTCVP